MHSRLFWRGRALQLPQRRKRRFEMYAKDPFHPLGGPDLEHNVIADQINESFCGRGCTCLICPKREIRMNPKIDDEFD